MNKERVRRLEKLGLMTDEGRKVLPDMDHDSFKIDRVIEQRLKEERQVYENFWHFQLFINVFGSTRYNVILSNPNYLRVD